MQVPVQVNRKLPYRIFCNICGIIFVGRPGQSSDNELLCL